VLASPVFGFSADDLAAIRNENKRCCFYDALINSSNKKAIFFLDMLDALRRALSVYGGDKSAWSRVIKNGMTADLSWRKPAAEYMALYTDLINNA
jgi:ATP-dependent exoDNAse (exonuclease V) beta subunit